MAVYVSGLIIGVIGAIYQRVGMTLKLKDRLLELRGASVRHKKSYLGLSPKRLAYYRHCEFIC